MLKFSRPFTYLFLGLFLSSTLAFAGSITAIDAKKKTVTVDEKFEKGSSVCFFNDKGKKIGCGKVSKAKGTESTVKVSKAKLKKLKEGMSAAAEGSEPGTESSGDAAGATAADKAGGKNPVAIKILYILGVMPPAAYNKLSYLKPDGATPATLWQSGGKSGLSFLGFGGEGIIPLMKKFAVAAGARYRMFSDFKTDSDYSSTAGNLHVLATQSASSIGFWGDFHYLRLAFSPTMGLRLGSGLDIEMNTMKFKATRLDDQGKLAEVNVAEASSKLTVISARLASASFEMMFGKIGISAGANLMLPLTASNTYTNAGDTADTNNVALNKTINPDEDLKLALGHKKNTIGLDLTLGLMVAF